MPQKSLDVFKRMKIQPDDFIFTIVLNSCALIGDKHSLEIGKSLDILIPEKYRNNVVLQASLLDMYSKCGAEIEEIRKLFDKMECKGISAFNTMMKGKCHLLVRQTLLSSTSTTSSI